MECFPVPVEIVTSPTQGVETLVIFGVKLEINVSSEVYLAEATTIRRPS